MTDEAGVSSPGGADPRTLATPATPRWDADGRPAVAGRSGSRDTLLIVGVAVLLGLLVLVFLGSRRSSHDAGASGRATASGSAVSPATPNYITSFEASSRGDAGLSTPPSVIAAPPSAVATAVPLSPPAARPGGFASPTLDAQLRAPAMVVDLAGGSAADAKSATATASPASGAATGPAGPTGLNGDEQFAKRIGAEEPERAQATVLRDQSETIPQGSMIPGVLETALDSDLPGYARAVVSREVRGFDGTTVLIPRGSRVIGQYKSAVAQGQSRAFVIWTRILRPDGGSIQIGSSGTDPLGRAGLSGKVNRHFLEEFSGSILLSVINAGIASIGNQPSTEVVIGSTQQATNLAGSAILPSVIPPTIKVAQGTPIRIFVARDLDFAPTAGAGK